MTARALESRGVATIVIGSAMDIVTQCNVPRYLHNNFPLGNPLGSPWNREAQKQTIEDALAIIETAQQPIVSRSSLKWPRGDRWQDAYNRVDDSNRAQLKQLGDENRAKRLADKARGLQR